MENSFRSKGKVLSHIFSRALNAFEKGAGKMNEVGSFETSNIKYYPSKYHRSYGSALWTVVG